MPRGVKSLVISLVMLAGLLSSVACGAPQRDATGAQSGGRQPGVGQRAAADAVASEVRLPETAPAGPGVGKDSGALATDSQSGSVEVPIPEVHQATPASKIGQEDLLPVGGLIGNRAPEFQRISGWINSRPLTMAELKGRVVLVDFWTYSCNNCINTMPSLKEWHDKYADKGLVIVGVHSPEFAFEHEYEGVVDSTIKFGLEYPVAQDNEFATWDAYDNRYWPAEYLIDRHGVVRYRHFGEGAYAETENQIRNLLTEAGADLSNIS